MTSPGTAKAILHRTLAAMLVACCALPAISQQRKPSTGPRAVGVLVIPKAPAGAKKPPQPYLIPIALWYQNRYFDAQLYGARPEPMALDGGVVYEIRKGSESVGLFTIDSVAQQEKKWFGGGQYRTMKEIEAREAARRARNTAPSEAVKDDGPPRLRRSDTKPSETSSAAPNSPPSEKPAEPKPAEAKPEPAPEKKTEAAAPAPKPAAPADDEDPDRPRLHRAPGGEAQTIAPAIKPGPQPLATVPKDAKAPASAPSSTPLPVGAMPEVLVAISDAKTSEPRPYDFQWSADEKEKYTKAIEQMASTAIAGFLQRRYHIQPPAPPKAAAPPRTRAGARATPPAAPAPVPLDNVQVRALDLQTDNYPEIIFSAQRTVQVPGPDASTTDTRTVYVTLVVRVDTMAADKRDQYRSLFTQVTDDRHMDETPRLQLIDTLDADGDGSGKLLFREIFSPADELNPGAWGFQLFRVGPDRLEKLYDSEGKIE